MADPVEVVVDIGGVATLAGQLWTHRRAMTESATFSYRPEYLAHPNAYALDPQLSLDQAPFHTAVGRRMFGAFTDCAPDRWGRTLIDRNERHRADREGVRARGFAEIDYLLGVRDDLRQGAVRFRDPETGSYVASSEGGVPTLIKLGALLEKAEHLERNRATAQEVVDLLRAGSSLGGARPKAHVLLPDGTLAIAKFPSATSDDWDVIRWEAVALELARRSGVVVPGWRLHEIDGKAVLIVTRFDRSGEHRVGYASAMTMTGMTDGDDASYLDVVEAIAEISDATTHDLHELWRRIALSLLISNTDDHLRNHGFLRASTAGWRLSPVFDINPNPRAGANQRATTIAHGYPNTVDTLLELADVFGLNARLARETLATVSDATSQWRAVAAEHGLSDSSIDELRPAFDHPEAEAARAVSA